MRCPLCNQYVPEGLGLKVCPGCNGDLTAAATIPLAPPNLINQTSQGSKVPSMKSQAPVASKQNSIVKFLFNFGYKRTLREALGLWVVYLLLGLGLSLCFTIMQSKIFHGHFVPGFGIKGMPWGPLLESTLLVFLILKQKRRFLSFLDILFAGLAIFISVKTGFLTSLLIISLLTMRSIKSKASSGPLAVRASKWWIWFLVPCLLVALIAAVLFLKSGRSYYIDSDQTVGMGVPDNRVYQFNGGFFNLTIRYPEDMYAPVLGQEGFLRRAGATHHLDLAVIETERYGLPVRFRVRSLELHDREKTHPFFLFQQDLSSDELKKKISQHMPEDLALREALLSSRDLLPQLDFSSCSNIDELYFGYELKHPPRKLQLNFEIEVYQLGGEPKKVVKGSIDLKRVDEDPMDWIKKQAEGRL
ncbi:MAG: hypothetical protein WCU74_08565 [Candidatus Omnitrophota bacterium]